MERIYETTATIGGFALISMGAYSAAPTAIEVFGAPAGITLAVCISGTTFLAWEVASRAKNKTTKITAIAAALLAASITVAGAYQYAVKPELTIIKTELATDKAKAEQAAKDDKTLLDNQREALKTELESLKSLIAENAASQRTTKAAKETEALEMLINDAKSMRDRMSEINQSLSNLSVSSTGTVVSTPEETPISVFNPIKLAQAAAFEVFAPVAIFLAGVFRRTREERELVAEKRQNLVSRLVTTGNKLETSWKQEKNEISAQTASLPVNYQLDNKLIPVNEKGEVTVANIIAQTGMSRGQARKAQEDAVKRGALVERCGRGNGKVYGYPDTNHAVCQKKELVNRPTLKVVGASL